VRDVERLLATYDTTASGAGAGSQNGGWIETSDFDAGTPGLTKLWNAITLAVDLPSTDTTVYVEYSVNGGEDWVEAGTASKTGSAKRYERTFFIGDASSGGVFGESFKVRMTLRTADTTKSPAVRSMTVRYLPVPEPNWQWDMTLILSDTQELLDGTEQEPTLADKLSNLEDSFRAQELVHFTDIDGTEWVTGGPGVLIRDVQSRVPFIGPSSDGEYEREVVVSLIEAVEAYES